MNKGHIQRFELSECTLQYDYSSNILLCRNKSVCKNLWIKKFNESGFIQGAIEDRDRFYLAIKSGENSGQFIALNKSDGTDSWSIPGLAFLFRLFMNSIFLIFVDAGNNFYLIKTATGDGKKLWHHALNENLYEYRITKETVILKYTDGKSEIIDTVTGKLLNTFEGN